ncbi:hypothetical protein SAMN04490244_10521 [Tranquillimonas rosea]|uniref:Probable membrane transporter protein n=1 Tax=Tranquillimonas rosea TaxID=641238 RepID=A0A1H9U3R1_9RHOB|nr:sulfite exporter TauE/SafE family protein [Tranquillimonas rosea]SES04200.1 hypothetical protein SAMN04490244_10521 [Tranquillimonas rosea]
METAVLAFAVGVTFVAGFVKGTVGFAMPMIMISGLASVLSPELALAALIPATVLSNVWQALRGGVAGAVAAARTHWRYIAIILVFIAGSAQLISVLPSSVMFLILGIPVMLFSIAQLAGWRLHIAAAQRRVAELAIGAFAGFVGGLSGVWGPPTVMYLTALETPKVEAIRIQGVVYGLGAIMLLAAHLQSGVLRAETAPLALGMIVPALTGMGVGFFFQDRLDQARFKRLTLIVLVVVGANLVRRGLMV